MSRTERWMIRLLPRHRRELGAALLAEAAAVPAGWRRAAWLAGGMWFVVKENAKRPAGYGIGLVLAAAALVAIDQAGRSDDAGQGSMLVLLALAGGLGLAKPRRAWLTALVLGSALALAGMLLNVLHPAWAHLPDPHGIAGAATLFVLIVPALLASYSGAGLAYLMRR
jgi:hypothetical protein